VLIVHGNDKSNNKMTRQKDQPAPARDVMRTQIEESLRQVYVACLEEELPPRLQNLVEQLRRLDWDRQFAPRQDGGQPRRNGSQPPGETDEDAHPVPTHDRVVQHWTRWAGLA
jgi:hypothetical protein